MSDAYSIGAVQVASVKCFKYSPLYLHSVLQNSIMTIHSML